MEKRKLTISTFAAFIALSMIVMTTAGPNIANTAYAQETFTLEIEGQTYEIEYEITNATLQDITADTDTQTLLVSINSTDDGTLMIAIPTEALDAEDDFSVFIDDEVGNSVVDELEPTNGTRVLQIEFPFGAEEIEIVGTSMGQAEPPTETETFMLEIEGQTYEIEYEITGGSVEDMSADPATKILLVTINSTSDGMLTIMLPRAVIDADDEFTVMIDDGNATADETDTTDEARTLSIEFIEGSSEIQIVGTFIVPEFGVISAIMLAGGIGAVLVAGWKYSKSRGLRPI